jgi:hypothetical protein
VIRFPVRQRTRKFASEPSEVAEGQKDRTAEGGCATRGSITKRIRITDARLFHRGFFLQPPNAVNKTE